MEPLDECILNVLDECEINENDFKTPKKSSLYYGGIEVNTEKLARKFVELGMDDTEANRIGGIENKNVFLNMAGDVQFMDEAKMMLLDGFEDS